MSDITDTQGSWLSEDELETVRARMPIVYVDAVPVRVDGPHLVLHCVAARRSLFRDRPDSGGLETLNGFVNFSDRFDLHSEMGRPPRDVDFTFGFVQREIDRGIDLSAADSFASRLN